MKNTPKFSFYERVRIAAGNRTPLVGFVMGRCEDDEHNWHYSVQLEGKTTNTMFRESELESTGEVGSREDFYDGNSLRVRVNDSGEGHFAEDTENNG